MKKIMTWILALALTLSMSVTAFAEDGSTTISPGQDGQPNPTTASATVSYNVAPTYTVTIPTKVDLERQEAADGTVTYKKDETISAENVRLNQGSSIQVTLAGNEGAFKMSAGQSEWAYKVTVGDSADPIRSGAVVATFKTDTQDQSATLHFAADDPAYAGNYTGTVTFTLSVVETSAQEGGN